MASILFAEEQVEIPLEIGTLAEFRRWALSPEFPEKGRIDFIDGTIDVDLSPENLFFHGTVKVDCVAEIVHRADELQLGHVLCSRSRVSSIGANLSVEPDIVVIAQESIDAGRVRLVPDGSGIPDSYVEIEGSPDLVVEILSDGSEHKDKNRLNEAYFRAGVREYWLVDVRGDQLVLQIHRRDREQFEPSPVDEDGYQSTDVLKCRYKLERRRGPGGFWQFALVRG